MLNVYNYMEYIVADELEKLLASTEDICKCQKCKLDITAWALNRLPPKYIVSEKGRVYTKLGEQDMQFRVDIIRELTKAILYVSKNQRH
jgi:competence protein ComFB